MDNMTPEFEEIYGNRRKTIERLKERNKKFAELTRVEFKRVILHIEGELVDFEKDELENLSARFVTHDRTCMFPAQHFEVSGTHFHLTVNIMSANNEAPIATGDYDLKIFTKYKGMNKPQISTDTVDYVLSGSTLLKLTYDNDGRCLSKQVLTNEYPCIISDKVETIEDDTKANPMNFKLRRGAENLFYAESASDMDTLEYKLAVTYKEPKPSQTLPKRIEKKLQNRKKLIIRDVYGLKIWCFKKAFSFFKHFAKKNGDIILFASGSRAEIGGNEKVIYDRMIASISSDLTSKQVSLSIGRYLP